MPLKLSPAQHAELLEAMWHKRVSADPNGHAYLEQWDVRRTLIRVFGFGGWEPRTKRLWLIKEIEYPPGTLIRRNRKTQEEYANDKTIWTVVYGAEVALTVHGIEGTSAVFEDGATGKSENMPSAGDAHDQAIKTALSQALKRCAVNLGDQFGLGLYNSGRLDAVVIRTLVGGPTDGDSDATPTLPKDETPVGREPTDAPAEPEPEPIGRGERARTYAGTEVDPDDGQTYATPPSGGLADDMRDADVYPLPPERPRSADGRPAPRREQPAPPPPADNESLEAAGARAVIRAREERARARQAPAPAAPRPAEPRDDGDAAALVDEILSCTDSQRFRGPLWQLAGQLAPAGRDTDVRRMLSEPAAKILRFDDRGLAPLPLGLLVQRAAEHFDQTTMSVRMALRPLPAGQPGDPL